MEQLNEKQLNARIESFITRKHQQYPELSLRGDKKRTYSIGYLVTDKISELVTGVQTVKLAH